VELAAARSRIDQTEEVLFREGQQLIKKPSTPNPFNRSTA
jgi:hypothetical protein